MRLEDDLVRLVEAVLMVADHPLTLREICEVAGADVTPSQVSEAIEVLNQFYENTNRSFRIRNIARGWQLFVLPEFSPWVRKLYMAYRQERLSRAALETLAIIAYKQPITKVEIEQIRGVGCDGVLRSLVEKGLVKIEGRKEVPGRPFLYVTTDQFLNYFGLGSLEDLPKLEEFEHVISEFSQEEVDLGLGEVKVSNREDRCSHSGSSQSTGQDQSEDRKVKTEEQ